MLSAFVRSLSPHCQPMSAFDRPRGAENDKMGKKIYWTNCLLSDSLGLGNTQNLPFCPIDEQLFIQIAGPVWQFNFLTVLCPTVQWLDSAVSNCLMAGLCIVQLSNGRTVLCQTGQWLDSTVSNFLMVGQCCVKLSNGWSELCPNVGLCCVQLSNGRTVLCQIVQWLDCTVCTECMNIILIFYSLKQDIMMFYTLYQNVALFVGQFGIKNLILSDSLKSSATLVSHLSPLCKPMSTSRPPR